MIYVDDSCSLMIKKIHTTLEKNANKTLKEADMTMAQQSVLVVLEEQPEHRLPLKVLEQKLMLSQSTVVGLVARLYQKGAVEYLPDPRDKRVKIASLTPYGAELCGRARTNMDDEEARLLSGLTDTEREILKSLLKKVCASL